MAVGNEFGGSNMMCYFTPPRPAIQGVGAIILTGKKLVYSELSIFILLQAGRMPMQQQNTRGSVPRSFTWH